MKHVFYISSLAIPLILLLSAQMAFAQNYNELEDQARLERAEFMYKSYDDMATAAQKEFKQSQNEFKAAKKKYDEAKKTYKEASKAARDAKKSYNMEKKLQRTRKKTIKASDAMR